MLTNEWLKTATLGALGDALRSKKISSVELTEAYLSRAKASQPTLGAFVTLCEEAALLQAKAADAALAAGTAGALTGIPLGIKDNICTKGVLTTCASRMLADFVPPYHATVIERLIGQNAVLLGKTNLDEFAMGSASQTSYFGGVCNPYDPTRVAGGSSGGSAVAVAAALVPAALGSDTGGSIRQPAAFCGVTGLKPTYGTVSRYGLVAFASSLDQIGPIARTAEDCGLLLNAIAGADPLDATTKSGDRPNYTAKIGTPLTGTVIGLPKEFFAADCSDEVTAALNEAVAVFRSMGCIIKEVSLPSLKYAIAAYYLISSAEAASNLARYDGIKYGYRSTSGDTYEEQVKHTRREGFGWEVKRRIMLGNYALSSGYYDAYYQKAVMLRARLQSECDALLQECDLLLTPTAPTTAYPISEAEKSPAEIYAADLCTVVANLTGLPAITTTCGYDKAGLPIGMSLTGRAFAEATLLATADAFEKNFTRKEAAL